MLAPTEPSPNVVSQMSLKGKVAVVTGGARGLGFEMMAALAESGAAVACVDLSKEKCLQATTRIAAECKVEVSGWGCDVTDDVAVAQLFEEIISYHGKVDIVVTAAGINKMCPALEYSAKDFSTIFQVNVNGTFYCMQQAAKHMMRLKIPGSIITIASMSAHVVNRPQSHAPYNATKAAVLQLTKSLATEWAPHRIRVCAISPGYFDTVMNQTLLAQRGEEGAALRKLWETETPMGRLGTPHELKGVVVFLASDNASFVTGSEIIVDGGYTCW
ncbi:putative short-chain dehydrogenase [Parasitella parasitica]|nr:putative short-chain dehydrogenase [Parasitella parasitica]